MEIDMTRRMEARLQKLETKSTPESRVWIWWHERQTKEQAIAERYPEGAPEGAEITFLKWMRSDEAFERG
jgi:hypothetical protein